MEAILGYSWFNLLPKIEVSIETMDCCFQILQSIHDPPIQEYPVGFV